jgi:hypothetical protein
MRLQQKIVFLHSKILVMILGEREILTLTFGDRHLPIRVYIPFECAISCPLETEAIIDCPLDILKDLVYSSHMGFLLWTQESTSDTNCCRNIWPSVA